MLCAEELEPCLTAECQIEKLHIVLAEDKHIFLTKLSMLVGMRMYFYGTVVNGIGICAAYLCDKCELGEL